MIETNLVLGGHSFIPQLGNDPVPTDAEAAEIVAACLDHGIVWFDTTYAPERVALGKALKTLGRRSEAKIIAWNFFEHFGPNDSVSGHAPYEAHHLQQMLDEFQTDSIDMLVVHPVDDPTAHANQEELARQWLAQGLVKRVATWLPDLTQSQAGYSAAVAPYNITSHNESLFEQYKANGWETFATSPFVRGWELETKTSKSGLAKSELADIMLRYSAFATHVDKLIVSIRKKEWVFANVNSFAKGPLSTEELNTLLEL